MTYPQTGKISPQKMSEVEEAIQKAIGVVL